MCVFRKWRLMQVKNENEVTKQRAQLHKVHIRIWIRGYFCNFVLRRGGFFLASVELGY